MKKIKALIMCLLNLNVFYKMCLDRVKEKEATKGNRGSGKSNIFGYIHLDIDED